MENPGSVPMPHRNLFGVACSAFSTLILSETVDIETTLQMNLAGSGRNYGEVRRAAALLAHGRRSFRKSERKLYSELLLLILGDKIVLV